MSDTRPAAVPNANAAPFASAMTAYLIWGVVGLYFKFVTVTHGVEPFTLLAHRVVWSLAFVVLVVLVIGRWREMVSVFRDRRLLLGLTATSLLIAVNWIVFIYAAKTGRLTQASLGYFLSPIVSVMLGVTLLGERLRSAQAAAILFATVGVLILFVLKASAAWIPIGLTLSWSFYALLRKRLAVNAIVGLGVETAILLPLAIAYMIALPQSAITPTAYSLLIAAGVITAVPLMLFAYAARRLRMITLGVMQYVGPTVQFLVARFIAGEQVSPAELASFGLIWLALVIFTVDSVRAARSLRLPQ